MKYWIITLSFLSFMLCILLSVALIIPRIVASTRTEQIMGNLFDVIALSASLISIALAIIAVWIAMYFKSETDKVNQKTQEILTEIKTDAKAISFYAVPELKEYGTWIRKIVTQNVNQNLTDTIDAIVAKSGGDSESFDDYVAKRTGDN